MLKIGFTGFVLDRGRSGIGTYVKCLLGALSEIDLKNRYDVYLSQAESHCLSPLHHNFHLHRWPNMFENPALSILWQNAYLPVLARRASLIHVPTIRRIPLIKGAPLIATIHDMIGFVLPQSYDRLRQFYYEKVLRHLILRCDALIAVSQQTKQDIIKYTGFSADKIHVIYSGIDALTYQPQERGLAQDAMAHKRMISQPFLLYVSRIEHPRKNHVNLITAFEDFKKKQGSNHLLLLVGADWKGAEAVKERIAESPYQTDIRLLGFLPQEELVAAYSAADLVIFPSLYEGFGFPLLEAMACGAPVICSNTSALAELATGYAELFDPLDPLDMSRAIAKALNDLQKTARLEKARIYATGFNWLDTARQVLAVYEKVARR